MFTRIALISFLLVAAIVAISATHTTISAAPEAAYTSGAGMRAVVGQGLTASASVTATEALYLPVIAVNAAGATPRPTATATLIATTVNPATSTATATLTGQPSAQTPTATATFSTTTVTPTPTATLTEQPSTQTPTATALPGGSTACVVTRSSATTPSFATSHPKVLLNHAATKLCLQQLLAGGAAAATRFKSMVDRQMSGGNVYGFQAWYAALLYQVTGNASYASYAVAQVDAFVSSEEALINQGQRPTVAYDSYLEVGDKIGDVMLVYDWCYAQLTPTQRSRWLAYANQAVWNVWHPDEATWGGVSHPWSVWSVDNPFNNYYYSFLRATMILGLAAHGEDAQAQSWIDTFRTTKVENQLFPAFTANLTGGGSREGTGYGTAMKNLFSLYDWWERSTGERIADRTPHTLAAIAHLLHNIVPTLDRLSPVGDHARDSSAALFDYHREYLLELMTLFPTERLAGAAKTLLAQSSVPQMANGFMFVADYLYNPPVMTDQPLEQLSTTYWGSGTGQLLMRSSWTTTATFANLICGPYTESHAHRDQGSLVLYKGTWLAYDANMTSHSGIEQDEAMHNLVRITQNGNTIRQVESAPPCNLLALADNAHFTYAVAQVTPIYNGHAAINKVERAFLFLKPDTVVIFDHVATTGSGIKRIWTLNTPGVPTVNGDRITYTDTGHQLDVYRLAPTGLTAELFPGTVSGETVPGKRIEVADSAGNQSLFLHVLTADNAVASAVRNDTAGQTGVLVTLQDGRTALVRFAHSSPSGTLDLRFANGEVQYNAALPSTVTAPPLFIE